MTPAEIIKVLQSVGLLTVKLAKDVYVVMVPARVTTLTVVNADGFQPHEKKEEILALRPVLVAGPGERDLEIMWRWMGSGARICAFDPDEIGEELAKLGFDLEAALEKRVGA